MVFSVSRGLKRAISTYNKSMAVRRGSPCESSTVLVSSFGLHFITIGMVKSFGVMYSELRQLFSSGISETSWVSSLSTGLLLGFGPIAGLLERRFGCRVVAIFGSMLITVGMVTSAFVPSLHWLFLTYGIITGIGFGMGHIIAGVSVNLHFHKYRSLAVAVASSGEGCGNIVIPWLTTVWLENYGWRGTFLLLAAITLHGVVFGALLFQMGTSNVIVSEAEVQEPLKTEVIQVLTNKAFILFNLSGLCVALAYFVPFVMIPDVATMKGISSTEVALVYTVAGVAGIVSRIVVGLLIDVAKANQIWALSGALLIGGMGTAGCAYFEEYWLFIVYGVILGAFTGIFGCLQSVITVDILGKRSVSTGFGFLTLFQGIAVTIGPPLAGWMADATNTFKYTFLYAGGMFGLGSVFAGIIQIRRPYSQSNKDRKGLPQTTNHPESSAGGRPFVCSTKL